MQEVKLQNPGSLLFPRQGNKRDPGNELCISFTSPGDVLAGTTYTTWPRVLRNNSNNNNNNTLFRQGKKN